MDLSIYHLNGSINLAADFLSLSMGAFLLIPTRFQGRDYPHGTTYHYPATFVYSPHDLVSETCWEPDQTAD